MTSNFSTLLLCTTISSLFLSACTSEDAPSIDNGKAPAIAVVEVPEVVEPVFMPIQNGRLLSGDVELTFDGSAEYAMEDDKLLVKFSDSQALIQVFRDLQPREGESYTLNLNVEQIGGDYNATARAIFSRDCSGGAEDYGSIVQELDMKGGAVFMQTSHTFRADYDCAKMVFQVTNAYPENTPITLRFDSSMATVEN